MSLSYKCAADINVVFHHHAASVWAHDCTEDWKGWETFIWFNV